jgi:pilus assembly protein Flp/PilA
MRQLWSQTSQNAHQRRGSIAVEYLLLATIVGIGLIVGLACVRDALVNELQDLARAIRLLI